MRGAGTQPQRSWASSPSGTGVNSAFRMGAAAWAIRGGSGMMPIHVRRARPAHMGRDAKPAVADA